MSVNSKRIVDYIQETKKLANTLRIKIIVADKILKKVYWVDTDIIITSDPNIFKIVFYSRGKNKELRERLIAKGFEENCADFVDEADRLYDSFFMSPFGSR